MKTIALVTYSQISAQEDKEILERILKSYAIIQTYCMEDGSVFTSIKADLIVVSADDMYRLAKKHAAPDAKIIVMEKTMSWDAVNKVKQLPIYSKALVVNVNLDMSRECIRQLYYLGISEIELIPYAPYIDLKSKPEIAISVGEQWAVPSFVKDVAEIGRRKIDVATIAYILVELGHPELFASEEAQAYCRRLAPIHHTNLPLPKEKSDDEFSLGEKQKGLISYNNNGKIKHYNLLAKEILGTTEEKLTGANILDIFSSLSIRQALMDMKPGQKKRFFLSGQYVQIQVFAENDTIGPRTNYMTLETLGAARERGKAPIPGRGYRAKHDFSDIITCSETMKKLMGLAERNAKKDSSILITGESGTGKELMAQAIHNASPRSREPFVAINCASLPESLLESELFGYEEGAFTGASRGGKKGLFEQANGGTLFLDEIGEMPIYLQTRLLRVLQEREVMRVGGDCVRDIDVRIVAASNRKLTRMIEEGSFRQDLYYRLNVIPLKLPPLRERPEDIPLLIQRFQEKLRVNYRFSPDAMEYLQSWQWPGNIRELQNCVEYFANWDQEEICLTDLLSLFGEAVPVKEKVSEEEDENEVEAKVWDYILHSRQEGYLSFLVLMLIAQKEGKSIGRRSLLEMPELRSTACSEAKLRSILEELENYGFLDCARGRGGTSLTDEGRLVARYLQDHRIG